MINEIVLHRYMDTHPTGDVDGNEDPTQQLQQQDRLK